MEPSGTRPSPIKRMGDQLRQLLKRAVRPGTQDWYLWAVQLRVLLVAGFPIIQALKILAHGLSNERQRQTTFRFTELLVRGTSVRLALDDRKVHLPRIVRGLLAVADSTGRYDHALDIVAGHYAWFHETLRLVKSLLWYPFAAVVLGTITRYSIDVYLGVMIFGSRLSDAMAACVFTVIMPVTIACLAGWIVGEVLLTMRQTWLVDKIAAYTPLVSKVSKVCSTEVFLSVFATTLEAGIPVQVGYKLAADAMPNQEWAGPLRKWGHFLEDGEAVTTTLGKTGLFDRTGTAMLAAGEVGTDMPKLMRKLAEYCEDSLRNKIKITFRCILPFCLPSVLIALLLNVTVLAWLGFITVLVITVNTE
jgi:type II secretory pathway component PulF